MLDFSGMNDLWRFEINEIEFVCAYEASAVNLPTGGSLMRFDRCTFQSPRDRAITSTGIGCQGLVVESCLFNAGVPSNPLEIIGFNVNANDAKIRNNRSAFCTHFGVFAGGSHIVMGNHIFPSANGSPSLGRAGLIFTTTNVRGFVVGNYIDHHFIELSNEHSPTPSSTSTYTFGGLSITGNLFLASEVSPAFRWIVISPKGANQSIAGLTVTGNVFHSSDGSIDRVERWIPATPL